MYNSMVIRDKKIITINVNENQRNIFLSCCWKLDALQYFNLFETPVLRWIWINLIEGQVLKKIHEVVFNSRPI